MAFQTWAYLRLAWRFAQRNRIRALLTSLGVFTALLAFLVLRTFVANWYSVNAASAKSDQLEVRHKISIAFSVYRRMADPIRTVPGVEEVSALIWFSGYYKDEKAQFGQLAVEGSYFRIHPEYAPPPEQLQSYMEDVSGAIVGSELAKRYGWKLGDKVTLSGTIFPGDWDFTVRGIFPSANAADGARLFMHYKRLQPRNEHAHRLVVKAAPSAAREIDALFANSATPTRTESQLALQRTWASWSSAVIAAINAAGMIILLLLALVLGNGMAMATHEATKDYATLRVIGYRSTHIVALVLAEGVVMASVGVVLGLVTLPAVLKGCSKLMEDLVGGSWQLDVDVTVLVLATGLAFLASMLASGVPAWLSSKRPIVNALRVVA